MNAVIELHDSRVSSVTQSGDTVTVEFAPAYVHRSPGRPGVDAGTGWTQDARMVFERARIVGSVPDLPSNVMDGDLTAGGTTYPNAIPLPFSERNGITLRLVFYPGCEVQVTGPGVVLEMVGEARYVEEFTPLD